MKKKKIFIIVIVLLALLFAPIPTKQYKDGGTKVYSALTYKMIRWNVMLGVDDIYSKTSIYWFPKCLKSVDELWNLENQ